MRIFMWLLVRLAACEGWKLVGKGYCCTVPKMNRCNNGAMIASHMKTRATPVKKYQEGSSPRMDG